MANEVETMRARLEKLESHAAALERGSTNELICQGVRIVDGEGQSRATFGTLPDGSTHLVLAVASGEPRIGLGVDPEGLANVTLFGPGLLERGAFEVLADGSVHLLLRGGRGEPRLRLHVTAEGATAVTCLGPDGNPALALQVSEDGDPSIEPTEGESASG